MSSARLLIAIMKIIIIFIFIVILFCLFLFEGGVLSLKFVGTIIMSAMERPLLSQQTNKHWTRTRRENKYFSSETIPLSLEQVQMALNLRVCLGCSCWVQNCEHYRYCCCLRSISGGDSLLEFGIEKRWIHWKRMHTHKQQVAIACTVAIENTMTATHSHRSRKMKTSEAACRCCRYCCCQLPLNSLDFCYLPSNRLESLYDDVKSLPLCLGFIGTKHQ